MASTKKMLKENLETKEDLIQWIQETPDALPFLEDVWENAVQKAENATSNQEQYFKDLEDGLIDVNARKPVFLTNPVKQYFRLSSLPQYRKRASEIMGVFDAKEDSVAKKKIMEVYFESEEEENKQESFNEITSWINMFGNPVERQYLKQRYANYYDNYQINEGADRTSLLRVLSLEIELYRFNMARANNKKVDITAEQKLTKMLQDTYDTLKWNTKQRTGQDENAGNAFTIWIDRQMKNGGFVPPKTEYKKDELDLLMEEIPLAVRRMLD